MKGFYNLDKLQIFRVVYQQIGQQPSVQIVYDGDITSTFTDYGHTVEDSTLVDLLSYDKMIITPKVIESKGDYLYAANIKYEQSEFEQNLGNDIEADMIAPSSGCDSNGYNSQMLSDNVLNYDVTKWYKPGTTTVGGKGKYVEWEYIHNQVYISYDNKKYRIQTFDVFNSSLEQLKTED